MTVHNKNNAQQGQQAELNIIPVFHRWFPFSPETGLYLPRFPFYVVKNAEIKYCSDFSVLTTP